MSKTFNISLKRHNVIQENSKWHESVKILKEKNNLTYEQAKQYQIKFELLAEKFQQNSKNKFADYFVSITNNSLNEGLKPSNFMMIKNRMVELQSSWITESNGKIPLWKVFIDGRRQGNIISQDGKSFKIKENSYSTLEEAIASMVERHMNRNYFGVGDEKSTLNNQYRLARNNQRMN